MELNRTDLMITFGMALAVIAMSFTMPAVGLTDESDEVNESDVPEFDMNNDRFDFVGDFPNNPGQPSVGTLEYNKSVSILEDNRRVWLNGDTSDGTELNLIDENAENATISLSHWSGDTADADIIDLNGTGTVKAIDNDSANWHIKFEFVSIENKGDTNNVTMTVDYTIIQQPADTAWFDRIPVLGGVVGAGEQLAGIVGWIGSIIYWFMGTLIEVSLNLVGILFDIVTFGFDFMSWSITTYESIVSAASGFAQVFVVIPAAILMWEFAKIGMIAISLLPTT